MTGKEISDMTEQNLLLLDSVSEACGIIQQSLDEHLASTTIPQYREQIERDIVTLQNLKQLTVAVRTDIQKQMTGACTELLLRIAANDFNNKLAMIPEKKTVRNRIVRDLKELHKNILRNS